MWELYSELSNKLFSTLCEIDDLPEMDMYEREDSIRSLDYDIDDVCEIFNNLLAAMSAEIEFVEIEGDI